MVEQMTTFVMQRAHGYLHYIRDSNVLGLRRCSLGNDPLKSEDIHFPPLCHSTIDNSNVTPGNRQTNALVIALLLFLLFLSKMPPNYVHLEITLNAQLNCLRVCLKLHMHFENSE